ncbi:MAG: hypothetical protein COB96_06175 [Planctomycetota bacterium]|nr:MAG: hypothetical protein COB96_06175 [Planctomycetota bacterium]
MHVFSYGSTGWQPTHEHIGGMYLNSYAGPDNVYKALIGEKKWSDITASHITWEKEYIDLIADEVAAANVPVVLAASGDHGSTHPERRLAIRYQALTDAEVTVALASGGSDGTAVSILSRAGDLVAAGLDPQVVWASLTSIPAEIAGLDATHGDLKVGVAADLINFQGSGPFNASATFRVFRADSGFDR